MKALTIAMALAISVAGCAGQDLTAEGPDAEEMQEAKTEANQTLAEMKKKDPGIQKFVDGAYGYAIFPSVGRGGLIVGGMSGDGWVFEKGQLVGSTGVTKVTVGAQAGGESFSQVIFFEDATSMNRFKRGDLELGAQVSAVALKNGAAARAGYTQGMAIFTMTKTGLMAEASVGGQKFSFTPIGQ
ncbi:MAG: lipid-binding SYLF domain-containing protein [Polyangiaceae bacterium]|nr:lipid-binding SYLF domain-containing protein [Polyangiaceae bacterium]